MSLVHNMKQTFSQEGRQTHPLSNAISVFYLANPNASEGEIRKFAELNKLNSQMERKNQREVNFNILNMKTGLKYVKPDEKLINEYENKINSLPGSHVEISMGMIDMIPDNIPKKVKKPEFQVINDSKLVNNQVTNSSSSYSGGFTYSSIAPKNLDDPKQISNLLNAMKKETELQPRLNFSISLKNIDSSIFLDKFVKSNGNEVIGKWIEEYKELIEKNSLSNNQINSVVDSRVYELLTNILSFCDKLPVTVQDLKNSKIGKIINKLGKCVSDKVIKTKCEDLVSRWKKMIENIKDKKGKDKYEKSEKSDKNTDRNEKNLEKNEKYDRYDKNGKYKEGYSDRSSDRQTERSNDKLSDRNSDRVTDKSTDRSSDRFSDKDRRPEGEYSGKSSKGSSSPEHLSLNYTHKKTKRDSHDEYLDKNNKKPRYEENIGQNTTTQQTTTNASMYTENWMGNTQNMGNSTNINNTNLNFVKKNIILNTNNSVNPNLNQQTLQFQMQNQIMQQQQIKKGGIKKGILKKLDQSKKEKRLKVKWEAESRMEKIKIFKMHDEPEANAVTEEEYQKIQLEILKNPNYKYLTDMRSKEINMEKENMSKAREKSKMAKDILFRMVPQISWRRPYELKLPNHSIDENSDGEYYQPYMRGSESEEKQIIDSLCQKILSVTYFRDAEIPDCPPMGASQLFSFTDENIPKIENMKKSYNAEKPNPNSEILEYINNNYEATPSPDFVKNLIQKLQNKEFTPEESNKISEYLNKHLNPNTTKKVESTPPPQIKMIPVNPGNQVNPISAHPFGSTFNQLNMNNQFNYNSSVNMPSMPLTIPLNNLNLDKKFFGKIPNFGEMKPLPTKYKTRPCRNYHGPVGCSRGDNCHFIHDPNYAGRDIPDFNLQNYKNTSNIIQDPTQEKKVLITNFNSINNYGVTERENSINNNEKLNDEAISNVSEEKMSIDNDDSSSINTTNQSFTNGQKQMNFQKMGVPMQHPFNRPPFTMNMPPNMQPNLMNMMTRPPYLNMNPQFMNQNPYMYMNFIRGQMPMPGMPTQNNTQQANQMESANK